MMWTKFWFLNALGGSKEEGRTTFAVERPSALAVDEASKLAKMALIDRSFMVTGYGRDSAWQLGCPWE